MLAGDYVRMGPLAGGLWPAPGLRRATNTGRLSQVEFPTGASQLG